VLGGSPGLPSDSLLRRPGEPSFKHVDLVRQEVPAGTTAMVVTAGGGGWGDPLERDPRLVASDVMNEYVSIEAARSQYGVVIKPETFAVDEAATARLRADLARTRGSGGS
jgi:N-methylhydantoinase B